MVLHWDQASLASKLFGNFKVFGWLTTGTPSNSFLGICLTPRMCIKSPTCAMKRKSWELGVKCRNQYISLWDEKSCITSNRRCHQLKTYSVVGEARTHSSLPSCLRVFIYLLNDWLLQGNGDISQNFKNITAGICWKLQLHWTRSCQHLTKQDGKNIPEEEETGAYSGKVVLLQQTVERRTN